MANSCTITVTVREVRRTPGGIELEFRSGESDPNPKREWLPRATLLGHGRRQHPDATEEQVAAAVDAYLAAPLEADNG